MQQICDQSYTILNLLKEVQEYEYDRKRKTVGDIFHEIPILVNTCMTYVFPHNQEDCQIALAEFNKNLQFYTNNSNSNILNICILDGIDVINIVLLSISYVPGVTFLTSTDNNNNFIFSIFQIGIDLIKKIETIIL